MIGEEPDGTRVSKWHTKAWGSRRQRGLITEYSNSAVGQKETNAVSRVDIHNATESSTSDPSNVRSQCMVTFPPAFPHP